MAITSLVATRFAPVTVTGITPLTGYNTVWISGAAGEVINVALSGGGRFGGPGGNASQILTLDGNGDGLVRVCFPASANGPATAVLTAKDASGGQWRRDARSSIFDSTQTRVMGGTLVKVLSWYDNEWGFSNRMLDTTVALMNAR